jgi:hypothetical protein
VKRLALVALSLLAIAPSPARADVIFDFNTLRSWTLQGCNTFGFVIPNDPVDPLYHPTACVDGFVSYGVRPSTGLYGVLYSFSTTVTGRIPEGGSVTAWACSLQFSGTGAFPDMVLYGSLNPLCSHFLGEAGEFFSPLLLETSQLSHATATYVGLPPSNICCGDFGGGYMTIVATPEPTTLALLGTGLTSVFGFASVRRRRRRREQVC